MDTAYLTPIQRLIQETQHFQERQTELRQVAQQKQQLVKRLHSAVEKPAKRGTAE